MFDKNAKRAEFVGRAEGFVGDARLFKLSEPIPTERHHFVYYVIVSTVEVAGRPETLIFPANASGEVLSWLELEGSMYGEANHELALRYAGYLTS